MILMLRRLPALAIELLAPRECVLCGLPAPAPLCGPCLGDCPVLPHACPRCALPVPAPGAVCGPCSLRPPPWSRAVAACRYAFPVDAVLGALKYRRDLAAAPALEQLMAGLARPGWPAGTAVVPLPLHRRRERARGFNQAALLARALAHAAGLELQLRVLARRSDTPPQVGLPSTLRRRNLVGAFAATRAVTGRSICLVDDVMTTGATLAAATEALRAAGARRVDCAVLARAPSAAQAGA